MSHSPLHIFTRLSLCFRATGSSFFRKYLFEPAPPEQMTNFTPACKIHSCQQCNSHICRFEHYNGITKIYEHLQRERKGLNQAKQTLEYLLPKATLNSMVVLMSNEGRRTVVTWESLSLISPKRGCSSPLFFHLIIYFLKYSISFFNLDCRLL